MSQIITEPGLMLQRYFEYFHELQTFVRRCVDAGIVRCVSPNRTEICDEPASSIFWQDQEEWYPCCGAHHESGQQWSGSTRYAPGTLELAVIPDRARAWVETLPADVQAAITWRAYDRTDWYGMIDYSPGCLARWLDVQLKGTPEVGWRATIKPLTNGQFAYSLRHDMHNVSWDYGLQAPFDSVEAATSAARLQMEQLRSEVGELSTSTRLKPGDCSGRGSSGGQQ